MGVLDEAAEAYVARVIGVRPGWSVQRMPVGHPGYDLLAVRVGDGARRRVSVKSRRSGDFQVAIDFTTYPADVLVLVDTAGGSHDEDRWIAYVVGAATAATLATDRRCVWLLTPQLFRWPQGQALVLAVGGDGGEECVVAPGGRRSGSDSAGRTMAGGCPFRGAHRRRGSQRL